MRKIRVLEIIPSCRRGGVPTVVYNLIAHLDRERFDVHLIAPNDGPFYEKFARLCPVYDIPIRGYYPRSFSLIRTLIRTCNIDIVHAHGKGAGLYGRTASVGLPVRTVYTLHGFNDDHYGPLYRRAYLIVEKLLAGITDRIVAVSTGERDKAGKAGILTRSRAEVIANGVAVNGRGISRDDKGHVLGTLSRTSPQKGLEYLIEAVAQLRNNYPDLICYAAGGTPKGEEAYEAALKEMIRERELQDRIVFLGEIGDIGAFFSRINLYISTSRWEGLPTAVLESFGAGVPVVATDVVGNNELVRDRETGILVKACDSDAIARGIEYAFENPSRLAAFAANAFRDVSENFSVDSMVKKHALLYESLLAQGRPSECADGAAAVKARQHGRTAADE
jgi:glycosyltransferase involved in cell wall biosynthesis